MTSYAKFLVLGLDGNDVKSELVAKQLVQLVMNVIVLDTPTLSVAWDMLPDDITDIVVTRPMTESFFDHVIANLCQKRYAIDNVNIDKLRAKLFVAVAGRCDAVTSNLSTGVCEEVWLL